MNAKKVECAINFIQQLKHTKSHYGQPFLLADFQRDHIENIFGPVDENGNQLITDIFYFAPKKMGKTEEAAAIALFGLWGQGEERSGEEIVLCASSSAQAGVLFNKIVEMIRQDPWLSKMFEIHASVKRITYPKLGNVIICIASDPDRVHGLNPSVVIADEIEAWKDKSGHEVWGILKKSMGARGGKTLWLTLGHAGYDRGGLGFKQFDYARQVEEGLIDNPHFLPILHYAKEGEDWTQEQVWRRVNKAIDAGFCSIESLRVEFEKAKIVATEESDFKMYNLCQWCGQKERWLPMDHWKLCGTPFDPEELVGKKCFAALDVGRTSDFSAFVLFFPSEEACFLLPYFWLPVEADPFNADLQRWGKDGFMKLTEGNIADDRLIADEIKHLCEKYRPEVVGMDPNFGDAVSIRLQEHGIEVKNYFNYMGWMSSPSKELERLVMSHKLRHNNHPVLTWMASNVEAIRDHEGRIRPSKGSKYDKKVDGIVALVMAIGLTMPKHQEARPGID